jgi:hypothetical protein
VAKPLIERLARINDPTLWSLVDDGIAADDAMMDAARRSSLHKAALCVRETMGDIEKNTHELAFSCMETGEEPWKWPSRDTLIEFLGHFSRAFLTEVERMRR